MHGSTRTKTCPTCLVGRLLSTLSKRKRVKAVIIVNVSNAHLCNALFDCLFGSLRETSFFGKIVIFGYIFDLILNFSLCVLIDVLMLLNYGYF